MSKFLTGKLQLECPLLRIFMACAKFGSVTRATVALDMAQSNVSKKLAELEGLYNMRLVVRQPRGVELTHEGQVLYNSLYKVFAELSAIEKTLDKTTKFDPKVQPIRIATSFPLGELILRHLLEKFSGNGEIKFEFYTFTVLPSLVLDNLDIIIWPFTDEEVKELKSISIKKLTTFTAGLYASQAYIDKHGMPQTLKDLENHTLITFSPFPNIGFNPNWYADRLIVHRISFRTICSVNSSMMSLRLAERGQGITMYAPEMIKGLNSNLINVLPKETGNPIATYFLSLEEAEKNELIKNTYSFLYKKLTENS